MTFFELLDKYLLSKSVKILYKIGFALLIIAGFYLANSIFGFTYSYDSNRLEAIEKTASLLDNPNIDSLSKKQLRAELHSMINDHAYVNYLFRFFQSQEPSSHIAVKKMAPITQQESNSSILEYIFRKPFLIFVFILSSTFIYLSAIYFFIKRALDGKNKKETIIEAKVSVLGLLFAIGSFLLSYFFNRYNQTESIFATIILNLMVQLFTIAILGMLNAVVAISQKRKSP